MKKPKIGRPKSRPEAMAKTVVRSMRFEKPLYSAMASLSAKTGVPVTTIVKHACQEYVK